MIARRGPTAERLLIVAAVLFAALLRAWDLDLMSIWQDEGLSLYRSGLGPSGILSGEIPLGDHMTWDVHPPLYFLLLGAWLRVGGWLDVAGSSIWAAKWLSLLASLPAIPLVWTLGRHLVGRRSGIAAAFLAAASPLYLWYAQEVRSYTLVVTLGLLAVYLLAKSIEPAISARRRVLSAVGCAIASALLVWTHYLGFLVVGFEVLVVAAAATGMRGRRALAPIAVLAAVSLAALPLLPFALWRLGVGPERDQHFVPLNVILTDVVRGFGLGRTFYVDAASMAGSLSLLAIAGFAVLLLLGLAHAWRRRRASALFLAGYLLVPVIGLYLLTFVKPVYLGSYHLIAASPAFYLLIGAGVAAAARRSAVAGSLAAAAAVAPMLFAGANFYTDPRFHKDDLRALAAYVDERAVPGDVLALSDPVLERSFEHLAQRLPVVSEPRMVASGLLDDRPAGERLAPLLAESERLWFMTPLDDDRAWLDENALLVDEEAFRGSGIPVYVRAYELPKEPAREPGEAKVAEPRAIDLGGLRLVGWDVLPEPLAAGQGARVQLAWDAADGIPAYKVAVRLLDADGRDWADGDHEPYHGEWPTSEWPTDQTVYEPHDLLVSPAAPPGTYRLAVTVYDPETGDTFPPEGPLDIGEVAVDRPASPVDPHGVRVGRRLWASASGLDVFGYDLVEDGAVAGGELPLSLWLAATSSSAASHTLRAELLDGSGSVVATSEAAIADSLRPGDIRLISFDLPLPPEGGRYGLRARVLDEHGDVSWVRRGLLPVRGIWLGSIDVPAPDRLTEVPDMGARLDVAVGERITLLGVDQATHALSPGDVLPVTLYWQATAEVPSGYHVSVQVVPATGPDGLTPGGAPVAQHDGAPSGGSRPTTGWVPGEIIVDRHEVATAPEVAPGMYLLIAALYDPDAPGQARPAVRQDGHGQDYVLLGVVEVGSDANAGTE
jgi:hypothetical protein